MIQINRKFKDIALKKARYKFMRGGRAGGKSHAIAQILLLKGKEHKLQILCLREYQKNLEESVYRLLCNKIREDTTLINFYRIMADRIRGANGTEFTFSGIKNAQNIKSFEGADVCWVEEAQTVSSESLQILIPTIRKSKSEVWFSYNPLNESDPVHQLANSEFNLNTDYLLKSGFTRNEILELQQQYDAGKIVIGINYYDNPFCPTIMKVEAQKLKSIDIELYNHIWEGEALNRTDAQIIKNYEIIDIDVKVQSGISLYNNEVINFRYGLDFGWVHPTAVIQSFMYKDNLYIYNEVCGKELTIDDITTHIVNTMPDAQYSIIKSDSARPDLIEQLRNARMSQQGVELPSLNTVPADKSPNSVYSGLTWLQSRKIYIHPRCINFINNCKNYLYKKNKDGIINAEPIKTHDDCIDALRYSYDEDIMNKGAGLRSIDWNMLNHELSTGQHNDSNIY